MAIFQEKTLEFSLLSLFIIVLLALTNTIRLRARKDPIGLNESYRHWKGKD